MNIESYVDRLAKKARCSEPKCATETREALDGPGIELWSDAQGKRFWLVLDEEKITNGGEPKGGAWNRAGARCLTRIGNPATVAEVHAWKRRFEATVRRVNGHLGEDQ